MSKQNNNTSKNREKKWIREQFSPVKSILVKLALIRVLFAIVNLSMTIVLSYFTDYAVGDRTYSLLQITLFAICIFVIEGFAYISESVCNKKAYSKVEKNTRLLMLSKIQNINILKSEKLHSGELMTRLTLDVEKVSNSIPKMIIDVFGGIFMAVVSLAYMFYLSWKMSVVILIAIPILGVLVSIFNPLVQKKSKVDKDNEDNNRIYMEDILHTIQLMKVFKAQHILLDKAKNSHNQKYTSSVNLGRIEGIFSFLNNITGSMIFLITMGFGAYLTANGEFTVGGMIAVINLLNYIVWPISNIGGSVSEYNKAIVSAERILEVIDLDDDIEERIFSTEDNNKEIIVDNVRFGYSNDNYIINDASTHFNKGDVIAIIGNNGSGKSTFINIILGLYKPVSGKIHINGMPSDKNAISFVPNKDFIFSSSVEENISMSENIDYDKMDYSLKCVNGQDFINDLKHGTKEKIGEGCTGLSSGQSQRIALARAIYNDSDLMIFDEPTSNLDNTSIEILHNTIHSLSENKIFIIATHNKSTIEICNRCFIIENGQITEIDKDYAKIFIDNSSITNAN